MLTELKDSSFTLGRYKCNFIENYPGIIMAHDTVVLSISLLNENDIEKEDEKELQRILCDMGKWEECVGPMIELFRDVVFKSPSKQSDIPEGPTRYKPQKLEDPPSHGRSIEFKIQLPDNKPATNHKEQIKRQLENSYRLSRCKQALQLLGLSVPAQTTPQEQNNPRPLPNPPAKTNPPVNI